MSASKANPKTKLQSRLEELLRSMPGKGENSDVDAEDETTNSPLRFQLEKYQDAAVRKLALSHDLSFRQKVDAMIQSFGVSLKLSDTARIQPFVRVAEFYGEEGYVPMNTLLKSVHAHHTLYHDSFRNGLHNDVKLIATLLLFDYLIRIQSFPFPIRLYRGIQGLPDRLADLRKLVHFRLSMFFVRPDASLRALEMMFQRFKDAKSHRAKQSALSDLNGLFMGKNEKERNSRALKGYAQLWPRWKELVPESVLVAEAEGVAQRRFEWSDLANPRLALRVQHRGHLLSWPIFISTSLLHAEARNFGPGQVMEFTYDRAASLPQQTRSLDREFSPRRVRDSKGKKRKLPQCCMFTIDVPAHTAMYFHGGPEEEFVLPPCTKFEVVRPGKANDFEVRLKVLPSRQKISDAYETLAVNAYLYLLLLTKHKVAETQSGKEMMQSFKQHILKDGLRMWYREYSCAKAAFRASPM